jgi:hypothetical protein
MEGRRNLDQRQNFNYFANWKIKSNYTGIIDTFDEDMVILEKWIPKNQFQPFIMMAKRAVLYQTFFGKPKIKRRVLSQNIKILN